MLRMETHAEEGWSPRLSQERLYMPQVTRAVGEGSFKVSEAPMMPRCEHGAAEYAALMGLVLCLSLHAAFLLLP